MISKVGFFIPILKLSSQVLESQVVDIKNYQRFLKSEARNERFDNFSRGGDSGGKVLAHRLGVVAIYRGMLQDPGSGPVFNTKYTIQLTNQKKFYV